VRRYDIAPFSRVALTRICSGSTSHQITVYVTLPSVSQPGGTGPVRINFAVPQSALSPAGAPDWRFIIQPVQSTPIYNVTITVPNDVSIPRRQVAMDCISVTSEFGIIVRRAALTERDISWDKLLRALEVKAPLDSNDDLISFGPTFGKEALEVFLRRLSDLGLEYYDDFFEFSGDYPKWCVFRVSASER